MLKKCLSISLSIFMLVNCMPINCFAQNADFVTENSKLIVPRINYGGSNLIEEGRDIFDRLMNLYDGDIIGDMIFFRGDDYSLTKVKELTTILEDYRTFLINIRNSQEVLTNIGLKEFESKGISLFEMLTEKYFAEVPDYRVPAILADYFNRKNIIISKKSNIVYIYPPYSPKANLTDIQRGLEENIAKINTIIDVRKGRNKNFITEKDLKHIKGICKEYVSYLMKENSESVKEIYIGFEQNAAKLFPTQESKMEFLQYIWEKTMKKMKINNPGSEQRLLQGLFLENGDTARTIIYKFQKLLRNLGKEASKHVTDSLKNMIRYVESLSPEELAKIMSESKELTPANKTLVRDVQGFVYGNGKNTKLSDILLRDAAQKIPEEASARAAAKAAGVVTPALVILGSLWILNTIVNIDSSNNSFANAMDPAAIKQKIKNGTASRYEQFAFYMMPSSAEYIEEDPVQFASVMFSAAEAVTNPNVDNFLKDPIMQIKDRMDSKNIGLNELDAALEKALNNTKLDDSQFPQA